MKKLIKRKKLNIFLLLLHIVIEDCLERETAFRTLAATTAYRHKKVGFYALISDIYLKFEHF